MRKSCHVVFIVRRTNGSLTFVSWHYDISLIWTCSSQSDVQRLLTPWTVMANHHSLYCNKNAGQCLSVATLDGSTGHTHTWDILQIWDKQQVEILVLLMYQILHTTVHRHTTIVTNGTFVNSREGGGGLVGCPGAPFVTCTFCRDRSPKCDIWRVVTPCVSQK